MTSRQKYWFYVALSSILIFIIATLAIFSIRDTPYSPVSTSDMRLLTPNATVVANAAWRPQLRTFEDVEMVLVPPGCFMMGSSDGEITALKQQYPKYPKYADFLFKESPSTRICFDSPFWFDRNDVSNAQFHRLSGVAKYASYWSESNRPRDSISWFEARNFCASRGARLPSEAEWEYAARGPDNLAYPWGNVFDPKNAVHSSQETADVGSKFGGASWVGALDMAGNLWQWTNSIYKSYPYNKDDGRENNSDDMSVLRMLRGGSWYADNFFQRSAYRGISNPVGTDALNQVGFRCIRSFD